MTLALLASPLLQGYLSTLEGRPFWQFYKFKRVVFEELAAQPLEWTSKIYAWAGLGELSKRARAWVVKNTKEGTRGDGSFSTKRDSRQVIHKWRGGLSPPQVRAANMECGDILYKLNYSSPSELLPQWQTTPGSAVGGRVISTADQEGGGGLATQYPLELMHLHWNAFCGKLSGLIPGHSGRGGHSPECQMIGTVPIQDCQRALEASTACSALSHHNGKCFLHDRAAADYLNFAQSHSKHAVKMLPGVDRCLVYDAPLRQARRYYYGAQLGDTIPDARKFYIYGTTGDALREASRAGASSASNGSSSHSTGGASTSAAGAPPLSVSATWAWDMGSAWDTAALVQCYISEFGIEPWHDERRHEMAQNTASLWLYEDLKRHPLRTLDPSEAHLFVMPIEAYVSASLSKPCAMRVLKIATPPQQQEGEEGEEGRSNGRAHFETVETTQESRNMAVVDALKASPYWRRHDGRDHLVVCAWWGAAKSWGKWKSGPTLWKMLRPAAILGTIDEYFARDWNKVLIVPYVAHALLTRWRKEPLLPFQRDNDGATGSRKAPKWPGKRHDRGNNRSKASAAAADEHQQLKGADVPQTARKSKQISATAEQTVRRRVLQTSEPEPPTTDIDVLAENLTSVARNVTFFFRGGILHGVDCKRRGTWVRRAAFEAFSEIPGARITATENLEKFSDQATGLIDPSVTERQRRQARIPNYNAYQYVRELRESQYYLHLRGDTSTSRRIYDALAAGCVPVIISDDSHLPFKSQIDWGAFTVSIGEDELIEHKNRVPQALIENPLLLREKQLVMRQAQEDLLYGYGSPYDPPESRRFKSNVASHLLQEAFELVPVVGKYRRFPETFSACTLVQTLWPE